jgi:hypothetical protein
VPGRGRPSAASTAPAAGKKSTTGALAAQTESLASNSFCALSCRLAHRSGARCVPRRSPSAASYLKSAIRSSPTLFSTCPTKADHGLRHFIEVGVDQVRQSSAPSFEAMPVEPTRSQNMTVSAGLHERWLRGSQSPRVNSELPNLTRQSTQRRAGVDPEARVRRSIPVRKECANSGHSPTAWRTGQIGASTTICERVILKTDGVATACDLNSKWTTLHTLIMDGRPTHTPVTRRQTFRRPTTVTPGTPLRCFATNSG